jgi:hypothetical protein
MECGYLLDMCQFRTQLALYVTANRNGSAMKTQDVVKEFQDLVLKEQMTPNAYTMCRASLYSI